jgi:putative DNA primase/helicase
MTWHLDTEAIARARAVPIADEIYRRGIKLRRVGLELVGACPVCGDGGKGSRSNRFAVHLHKNAWLCRRCQRSGGVVDLVMHLDGVGFKEAVAVLAGGKCPSPVAQHTAMARPVLDCAADEERKRQRALQWWEDASPIGGTPAERYLVEIRKLVLPPDLSPRVLRFHPDCPFSDDGTRHPCLLALYRRIELPLFLPPDQPVEAEPRAVMRTALTVDGKKIGRMAYGPVRGAAIKLSDDADVTTGLVIGEGLETTLAGMVFGFAPAWALGSAGGIAKFPVLSGIEALTVLAETEDGGANERASRECFARWSAAGREVLRATSMIGCDANDALTMAVAGDGGDTTDHGTIQTKRA